MTHRRLLRFTSLWSVFGLMGTIACGWPAMPGWPKFAGPLDGLDGGPSPADGGGLIPRLDGGPGNDAAEIETDSGDGELDGGQISADASELPDGSVSLDANDTEPSDAGTIDGGADPIRMDGGFPAPDDPCERAGRYGDGLCNVDCPMPDPDCVAVDGGTDSSLNDGGVTTPSVDAGVPNPPACDEGFHLEDSSCEPNSRSCFVPGGEGRQTWDNGWSDCEVESCGSQFHLVQNRCEANEQECFISNGLGTQVWQNGRWGACVPVRCNNGFHEKSGRCIANSRSCSIPNGSGRENWLGDDWSECQLVICYAGYHVEGGACIANEQACEIENGQGARRWSNGAWGQCAVQSCELGFHPETNSCASNLRTCDVDNGIGQSEWTGQDWGPCVPTECSPEHHIENNACLTDQRTCDIANGSGEQHWSGTGWNPCEPTSCELGFHAESQACVNDIRACRVPNGDGDEHWEGSDWGLCVLHTCDTNFHDGGNGVCVPMNTCSGGFIIFENGRCEPTPRTYESHFGIEFALIPLGTFERGSPNQEPARNANFETLHFVSIPRPFALSITEITQAQWQAITNTRPSGFDDCGMNCPVEQVDWYSALAFANALSARDGFTPCYEMYPIGCAGDVDSWGNGQTSCTAADFVGSSCSGYRLPTEAEWEYAYRARSTTPFYNGEITEVGRTPLDVFLDKIGWYGGNSAAEYASASDCASWGLAHSFCGPQQVKRKRANPWGLYDMSGNVKEWIWDWLSEYPASAIDPSGPTSGDLRGVRGGAWNDEAGQSRAASRHGAPPNHMASDIGFRLARTLPLCEPEQDDGSGVCAEFGSCASGFHAETHYCVPNRRGCLVENGVGEQEWQNNSWSACQKTNCHEGYHDDGTGNCVALNICALGYEQHQNGDCVRIPPSRPDMLGIEFTFIPSGTFSMGTPNDELGRLLDEEKYSVTISYDFAMSASEITQLQWEQVAAFNPSYFGDCGNDCPVERIDWFAALAYANQLSDAAGLERCYALTNCDDESSGWQDGAHTGCNDVTFAGLQCLGYRLPTEAEWEYAYRATTTSAYYSGPNFFTNCAVDTHLDKIGWYCGNSDQKTHPVRQKQPNLWGVFDIAGNVREWTNDWYDAYPGDRTDPVGPTSGTNPIVRGGSWQLGAGNARAGRRTLYAPDAQSPEIGFRIVRTLSPCPTGQRDGGKGECVSIDVCVDGFHDAKGLCTPNLRRCSLEHGQGLQAWSESGWGPCELSKCDAGFHDGGDGFCLPAGSCSIGYQIDEDGNCAEEQCVVSASFALNELPVGATYAGGAIPNRGTVDANRQCWSQTSDWQHLSIPLEQQSYAQVSFEVVRDVERQSAYVSFQGVNLRFGINGTAECNHDCHATADYGNSVSAFVWDPEAEIWVGQWSMSLVSSPTDFNEYAVVFDDASNEYAVYENDTFIGGGEHPAPLGAGSVGFGATAARFEHAGTCWRNVILYSCP